MLRLLGTASAATLLGNSSSSADNRWWQGDVMHLLPLLDHRQVLLKSSFRAPLMEPPYLRVNQVRVAGQRSDTLGRFWQFHVDGLEADSNQELQLETRAGRALTDPWPLRTFPAPETAAEHLKILAFTCAGGSEHTLMKDGSTVFLPLAARQRLLDRGLSFAPDVVLANGDHVYCDMSADVMQGLFERYGHLDASLPVLGTANERILTGIVDEQLARLYGVRLRSTPSYFLTDDHDLFENDEASDAQITLPPDRQMLDLARTTQALYYPEFLPDGGRPGWLAGSSAGERRPQFSESFGTLRYGTLLEALLYDTKRYVTLKGPQATMVPSQVERWLTDRTRANDTAQLMHVPSTPLGWSAGKWGEWYPDVLQGDGRLGIERAKAYWPHGWWSQHQRLLQALHDQRQRAPLIVSGDLHASAAGRIEKSGSLDLSGNPVHTLCVGTVGSAGPAFPSAFRGTPPQVPSQLVLEQSLQPTEKNGFTLFDVRRDVILVRMFAWRPPEPLDHIDTLEPFHSFEITLASN
jgi:hypothetical protein